MLQNKKNSKDSATARFYSHVVVSLLLCLMLLPIEPDFKVCVLWLRSDCFLFRSCTFV